MIIDIIKFLEDHKIHYQNSGKDIGSGFIGCECPYCEKGTNKNHLGFSISNRYNNTVVTCWRCGTKNLLRTLSLLVDKEVAEIKKIIVGYSLDTTRNIEENIEINKSSEVIFPNNLIPLNEKHYQYLESRNFNGQLLERDWQLKATGDGNTILSNRIIIPVTYEKKVVSFVGRDFTGQTDLKAFNCNKKNEVRSIKDCLLGFDYLNSNYAIVTEGAFDAFRFGKGNAVCTFGTNFTIEQVKLLSLLKHVFICFDSKIDEYGVNSEFNAQQKAQKLADQLSLFNNVYIIEDYESYDGDPATMKKEDVNYILNYVKDTTKLN